MYHILYYNKCYCHLFEIKKVSEPNTRTLLNKEFNQIYVDMKIDLITL